MRITTIANFININLYKDKFLYPRVGVKLTNEAKLKYISANRQRTTNQRPQNRRSHRHDDPILSIGVSNNTTSLWSRNPNPLLDLYPGGKDERRRREKQGLSGHRRTVAAKLLLRYVSRSGQSSASSSSTVSAGVWFSSAHSSAWCLRRSSSLLSSWLSNCSRCVFPHLHLSTGASIIFSFMFVDNSVCFSVLNISWNKISVWCLMNIQNTDCRN